MYMLIYAKIEKVFANLHIMFNQTGLVHNYWQGNQHSGTSWDEEPDFKVLLEFDINELTV